MVDGDLIQTNYSRMVLEGLEGLSLQGLIFHPLQDGLGSKQGVDFEIKA